MKIMKKKIALFVVIFLVIGIITGVWYYRSHSHMRFQNVFDQLHHTRHSGFGRMRSMSGTGRGPILAETGGSASRFHEIFEHDGTLSFQFTEPTRYISSRSMHIELKLRFLDDGMLPSQRNETEEHLYLGYYYDVETKTLTLGSITVRSDRYDAGAPRPRFYRTHRYPDVVSDFMNRHNLTQEEVQELLDYALFDYFLPLWYETTQSNTRFSPDNWGEFTLVVDDS